MKKRESVWIGHIPKKYHYNPALPKPSCLMSWTNMNSDVVWNAMKKNAGLETEKLKKYRAPEGFALDVYTVDSDNGSFKMYGIQQKELKEKKNVPAVIYIHGGGFYYPLTAKGLESMIYYAEALGAKVFVPDYRTSIDDPYPVPLADCCSSVKYLESNADELGIDLKHMIVYGNSAGACLAACLTQYIRDFGGTKFCGQMLVYPVTDNSVHYQSKEKYRDAVWSLNSDIHMWNVYLRNTDKEKLKYAVPMQSDDFGNLPQAYIEPAEIDILHDEGLAYAKKLKDAGVIVEIYESPGCYHGFDEDQTNNFVRTIMDKRVSVMRKMFDSQKAE